MSLPAEREFDLSQAERRIDTFLLKSGLTCELEHHGDDFGVCFARIRDRVFQVSAGAGKGDMKSARIGAKYEAAEHWLTERWGREVVKLFPVDRLLTDVDGDSLPYSLLATQRQATVACRSFIDLQDGSTFACPLALFLPRYDESPMGGDTVDYRNLRRYVSNSGTAIGGSVDEATLHALNESIERDAVSLFLLRHFYYRFEEPLRRIHPGSLTGDVERIYRYLTTIEHGIVLLDISNGCGVTTCLAFFKTSYDGPHVYGAGASLNPSHAAYRALSELLQLHLVAKLELCKQEMFTASRSLHAFPALHRAFMFDVRELLRMPEITVEQASVEVRGLREQITDISTLLCSNGIRAGYCVLGQSPEGIVLVSVAVPAFERFFVVGTGNAVLPGARGRSLAAAAS